MYRSQRDGTLQKQSLSGFVGRPILYNNPGSRMLKPASLQNKLHPVSVARRRTNHGPEDRAPAPVYGNVPMAWDPLNDPAPKTFSSRRGGAQNIHKKLAQNMVSEKLKPLCTEWFKRRQNEGLFDTWLSQLNENDFKQNFSGRTINEQFVQEMKQDLIDLRNDKTLHILNKMEAILEQIQQHWLRYESELDVSDEENGFFQCLQDEQVFDELSSSVDIFLQYCASQHSNECRKKFIIMSKMLKYFVSRKKRFMDDQCNRKILMSTEEGRQSLAACRRIENDRDMRVNDSTQHPIYYVALNV
jgi:hypothetical protein